MQSSQLFYANLNNKCLIFLLVLKTVGMIYIYIYIYIAQRCCLFILSHTHLCIVTIKDEWLIIYSIMIFSCDQNFHQ